MENYDLYNKLNIIQSLIYDIIKKYCKTPEEFDEIVNNPILYYKQDDTKEFEMIEYKHKSTILERIETPIKVSLLSTCETINGINEILTKINEKINNYNKSYLNKLLNLCLKNELSQLKKKVNILDMRLQLFFQILNIYGLKK
jgi:hypothetical protein